MSNTQFTPGPWYVRGDNDYAVRNIKNLEGTIICSFNRHTLSNMARGIKREANANLIAAAPDMYNALQAIANRIDSVYRMGTPTDIELTVRDMAKAALNKANPNK